MLSFNGHMYVQGPVLTSPDRDAAVKRISDVPGVVSVTPLTESPAMFRAGGAATGGVVRGVRPQDLASTKFVYDSLTPEARERFGKGQYGGDHVLIGKSLAEQMGLREGDPISLYSPTGADSAFGNLGGLEKTYIVGGIYTSGAADYDRAFIFMPLVPAIKRAIGKKRMFYVFLTIAIIGMVMLYVISTVPSLKSQLWLVYVAQFVKSTGIIVATGYMWALVPEVISYGEW